MVELEGPHAAELATKQLSTASAAGSHLGVQVGGARLVCGAPHRLLLQDGNSVVADDGLRVW